MFVLHRSAFTTPGRDGGRADFCGLTLQWGFPLTLPENEVVKASFCSSSLDQSWRTYFFVSRGLIFALCNRSHTRPAVPFRSLRGALRMDVGVKGEEEGGIPHRNRESLMKLTPTPSFLLYAYTSPSYPSTSPTMMILKHNFEGFLRDVFENWISRNSPFRVTLVCFS